MDLDPDVLLSILFIAIIANTALIVGLVVANRSARRRALTTSGHASAVDRALSTSYVDHSARAAWTEAEPTVEATVPADDAVVVEAEPEPEPEPEPRRGDRARGHQRADRRTRRSGRRRAGSPDGPARRPDVRPAGRPRKTPASRAITDPRRSSCSSSTASTGSSSASARRPPTGSLPALADTIRRLARSADHVARLGPGRFAVLLPETDEVAAINYVERVRRACDLWLESGAMALTPGHRLGGDQRRPVAR